MKTALYCIWQFTWGFLQSLLGLLNFLIHIKDKHYFYHGAVLQNGKTNQVSRLVCLFLSQVNLIFMKSSNLITQKTSFLIDYLYTNTDIPYSHLFSVRYILLLSAFLQLYGVFLPYTNRMRREKKISYFSFFTERWANELGERATNQKSMDNLVID